MSRSPRRLVFLPLALAITLAACGGEPEAQQRPPTPVTVVTLAPETTTLTRELPGRTTAFQIAEVRPQVSGIVAKRLFQEGSMVKAGQPLYQLDNAAYKASAATAQAQLARARATLVAARLTAARSSDLAKIDAVSKQDNENAIAALRQAEAEVAAGQAAVQSAQVTLGFAHITAPISGRIGKSSVTQGALVTANQPEALATVQQLDPIYVDLTQSASELLELRKGLASGKLEDGRSMPVTILLEDGTEFGQKGELEFSEVSVDPTTGSYALRVKVANPDDLLLPGMYVRAVIGGGVRQNAILVPQQGITRDPKGHATAMVVNAENKVEVRQVKVSRTIGDKWLVDDGLVAGDRVIVEGLQKVQPDAPVQPTEAGAEAQAPAAPGAAAPAPAQPAAASPGTPNPDAADPAPPADAATPADDAPASKQ
ncbi:efflux RND transporter periplasmic adaptor subunit [Lysobacter ciconiae]|uniref:Efflux RND transporter periplasmic adaptor subunit n=1 Tax=Novilysobacter ciconiae TaxID=2781022 RepID=A0A7S6ZRJ4_9GAMM|nr:efflux RND transporter periplasmic adaptor subunit [Lysobacter ciconiae]QOW18554.1 efflux RND transporter periplasmic adaptor subunit [Lysobacter ciconiae]